MTNNTLNPFAPVKKKVVLRRDQIIGGSPEWDNYESKTTNSATEVKSEILGSINFQSTTVETKVSSDIVSNLTINAVEGTGKVAVDVAKNTTSFAVDAGSSIIDLFKTDFIGLEPKQEPFDAKKEEKKQEGLWIMDRNKTTAQSVSEVKIINQQNVAKTASRLGLDYQELIMASNPNTSTTTSSTTEVSINLAFSIVREKEEKKKALEQSQKSPAAAKAGGPNITVDMEAVGGDWGTGRGKKSGGGE